MLYLFIAVAFLFIPTTFVFLKKIKAGRLTSSFVNSMIVIFGIALFFLPFQPQPRLSQGLTARVITISISFLLELIALYLFIGALRIYRKYSVPIAPHNWTPPRIIDEGVYSIVRHPQYLAELLAYGGLYLFMRGLYAICIIYPILAITLFIRAHAEEKYLLRKKFPREYADYQKKAGMFIPKLW